MRSKVSEVNADNTLLSTPEQEASRPWLKNRAGYTDVRLNLTDQAAI
jgi:hypothetical protein